MKVLESRCVNFSIDRVISKSFPTVGRQRISAFYHPLNIFAVNASLDFQ